MGPLLALYRFILPPFDFTFASGTTPEPSKAKGYGDVSDPSAGGVWASAPKTTTTPK